MCVKERLTKLSKPLHRGDVAVVHLGARKQERELGVGRIAAIDRVEPFDELIIRYDLAAGDRVCKRGIEAHRSTTVGSQLGNGRANSCALVLAERERAVFERPA